MTQLLLAAYFSLAFITLNAGWLSPPEDGQLVSTPLQNDFHRISEREGCENKEIKDGNGM